MNTQRTLSELRQIVKREQETWPRGNKTRQPNGKNPFPLRREILSFYSGRPI